VAAIPVEEVVAAVQQHLRSDPLRLVVVGGDPEVARAAWQILDAAWGTPGRWVTIPEAEVFR
jgi:hypothetical protein